MQSSWEELELTRGILEASEKPANSFKETMPSLNHWSFECVARKRATTERHGRLVSLGFKKGRAVSAGTASGKKSRCRADPIIWKERSQKDNPAPVGWLLLNVSFRNGERSGLSVLVTRLGLGEGFDLAP